MLTTLLLYVVLGALAGVVAGLFGIGGGLLIVPVLVFSFELQGIAPEVLTHMAVATSLATIVVTSISSVRTHHQHGAVRWELFKPLAMGILLGAVLGVNTAVQLPGGVLQIALGIFALLVAIQMALNLKPGAGDQVASKAELSIAGGLIGWASSIFGIGGGTLSVPYLSWRRIVMQQAVATSAACGLPIAVMGALTNIWMGWGEANLPAWSLGYVYMPAFAGIVLASSLTAPIGARLAHRLSQPILKKIFAVFLVVVGGRFILSNLGA
ncbi:sulfite exporter TauE/SafE family protein [Marinobacterium weihaiense]|uniref:Probable membrane transporter protein n=1 Tax=Marinobacterium weihaiense TaxID=2851016 RepID=A0ABS6MBB6_9GAMM|nr:sulfite exporter TauE/SafE family protein [Marinobacterium weihaiense]MBV0933131.1 sulfite exporter TauE/SafE family protein [Marinobacterium weihaiense]